MAQLSTIPELSAILAAAQKWKEACLLNSGSMLSHSDLWTPTNLAALDKLFIQHPIMGGESFLEKFRQQLEPAAPEVKQLAAELLWLLFLFPSNITGAKKRQNIAEVWSWSASPLDEAQPSMAVLDHGIGSAGAAYNSRRPDELTLAIRIAQRWKEGAPPVGMDLLADPWRFGSWVDSIPEGNNRQFRHMLLFLLFPDTYERIASGQQKAKILGAFQSLPGIVDHSIAVAGTDSARVAVEKKLLSIRRALEHQYAGQEIDFYEPPVVSLWQPEDKGETEEQEFGEGPRFWIEKTIVKGRPDREEGDHALGKALWSPQRAKDGRDIYANMRAVQPRDVVLHLIDNKQFSGISLVAGPVDDTFQGLQSTAWEGSAYRIPLRDYVPLDPPLAREDFLESPEAAAELRRLRERHRGLFYTEELNLNQGMYLTSAPPDLVAALNRIYQKLYGKGFPHIVLPELPKPDEKDVYSVDDAMLGVFLGRAEFEEMLLLLQTKKNVVLQGPPGVGKTFIARRLAYALLKSEDRKRIRFVQFHQSYSYEDFIEGYRPQDGSFVLRKGLFRDFCEAATADSGHDYVLVVDEINRGNLSKIFGELLMLVEHDKRSPAWSIRLAYSGAEFYVPANLHLIGLMNTADSLGGHPNPAIGGHLKTGQRSS
jgi:hypothetical protein